MARRDEGANWGFVTEERCGARVDRFVLPNGTVELPVVWIFYLVDGKIAEWTDFVFGATP